MTDLDIDCTLMKNVLLLIYTHIVNILFCTISSINNKITL